MATTIRELLVSIGVEVDAKELDVLDKKVDKFKQRLGQLAKFTAAATGALAAAIVTSTMAGDAAAKGADRTGILVERYQELAFAAGQAGASQENLQAALRFANVQLNEAEKGSAGAKERFDELGISTRTLTGAVKTSDQILLDVARSLEGVTDQALIGAKAARVFGEEAGPKLVPMLRQGEAGVLALLRRARELGGVIGEKQARESEYFLDRLDDLKTLAFGLRNAFVGATLPALNRFVTTLIDLQVEAREVTASKLETWGRRVAVGFDVMRRVAVNLSRALKQFKISATWVDALAYSVGALGAVAAGATLVAGAGVLRALFAVIELIGVPAIKKWVVANAVLLVQIGAVVAVFAAAGLAIEDFLTFMRGGDSVIGRFLESIGMADDAREAIVLFATEGKRTIDLLLGVMEDLFDLDGTTWTESWLTGMREVARFVAPFVESTITGLRELGRLFGRANDVTERDAARRASQAESGDEARAVSDALRRRARREGRPGHEFDIMAERIERGTVSDLERQFVARHVAAAQAARAATVSTDRSRTANVNNNISFSGVPPADQEAVARRVIAAQTRQVRADLVDGGSL